MINTIITVNNENEYREVKTKLDNTGYVLTNSIGDTWEYTKGNNVIIIERR